MQNNEINLNENLIIYTHTTINLDFFNPAMEHLRPLNMVQKPLSALACSQTDKVAIIIVDDLAELSAIPIGSEHSIVIIAKNNLTPLPEHLSNTLIYQQASNEDYQQALVFPLAVWRATSKVRFLGKPVSPLAWPKTPTAPVASC